MTRGKPAVTAENGYLGMPAEDMVQRNATGVFRLLRYLTMWPGAVPLTRPAWVRRFEVLRSPLTRSAHGLRPTGGLARGSGARYLLLGDEPTAL
jgi:hypothetical protein